jgi:hypothetical protein
VSDEYAVPLCRSHHRALHRCGNEPSWWETQKIDPIVETRRLWQRTRLDGPHGGRVEALLGVESESPRPGQSLTPGNPEQIFQAPETDIQ